MTDSSAIPKLLQTIRAALEVTQAELAERLGVSFATVNRWEGGSNKPQKAQLAKITALAEEAGIGLGDAPAADAIVTRRRGRQSKPAKPTTKPMEQMLWDAACSIRGEKDAPKFRDYLLPLLFLKRLSDVFDDEIDRLAEEYGDRDVALEIADHDHELLRFYLPVEARWGVVSGRTYYDWPIDERGRSTRPRDVGEHLTKAVRAVVRFNPSLAGVIDVVDFAAERNGERDINPAKLNGVVETFSDPRYRLGLADVQPDFLGRAYEYLLRKFAEGSGQSAGEFFTPTEVGFLMARILRPKPGQTCHDYACGSSGLLIKLQLIARELDPTGKIPLRLFGQERQAESYAVAQMNSIIHDMDVDLRRGDTMINPKFLTSSGSLEQFDLVIANPMWNQSFDASIFEDDPYDRYLKNGGATSGKGDWAWLQHTLSVLKDTGRAAVVLDTGAVTRGSGSRNEDKERNIRKWFVDHDLVEGVILLPDNLFYNTTAAGIIVVLNKHKPESKKGKITLLNASKRFTKGKPKNHLAEEDVIDLAKLYNAGEEVQREVAIVTLAQVAEADYNLSPSRWVSSERLAEKADLDSLLGELRGLSAQIEESDHAIFKLFSRGLRGEVQKESEIGPIPENWSLRTLPELCEIWSGGTPKKSVSEYWGGDIPWVSGKDLKKPALDDATDHVSQDGVDNGSRIAPTDSVLLLVRGMGLAKDLPVAVINRPMAFNQDVKALIGKAGYSGRFLRSAIYAGKERLLSQLATSAHGTKTLNLHDLENFLVPTPSSTDEADKVAEIMEMLHRNTDLHRRKHEVLERLSQALLQKLMNGEVLVDDLDLSALDSIEGVST